MKKTIIVLGLLVMLCTVVWAKLGDELIQAAKWCDIAEVKSLIEEGADVNYKDEYNGYTALMIATIYGCTEIIEIFISAGANLDLQSHGGMTALMIAANNSYIEIVQLLIDAGANLELEDDNGWSALDNAIEEGFPEIVEMLEEAGLH